MGTNPPRKTFKAELLGPNKIKVKNNHKQQLADFLSRKKKTKGAKK